MRSNRAIILVFILALLAGAAVVSPGAAAPNSQATATPTAAPTEEPVNWKVYSSNPDYIVGMESVDPLLVELSNNDGYSNPPSGTNPPEFTAGIVCSGADCVDTDIYYRLDIGAQWVTQNSQSYLGDRNIDISIQYSPSGFIHYSFPCGSGVGGTCEYKDIIGVLPASYLYWNEGNDRNFSVKVDLYGGLFNLEAGPSSVTYVQGEFSTEPIDCEEDFITYDDVAFGNIPATLELPSPTALVVGEIYRLELGGGPWNSNRYDAGISLDGGSSYRVISASPTDPIVSNAFSDSELECISRGADNQVVIFFTASTDNFRIRVNDTPGSFANNTGAMEYRLSDAVANDNPTCSQQFSYSQATDLLATGPLAVTSPNGSYVALDEFAAAAANAWNIPYATLTPNQWYLLTFTGPWQDSQGGNNRNTYQLQSPVSTGGAWQDITSYIGTDCVTTGDGSISYYFQANGVTSMAARVKSIDSNWANNTGSVTWVIYGVTYTHRPTVCSSTYTLGDEKGVLTIYANNQAGYQLPGFNYMIVPDGIGGEIPEETEGNEYPSLEDQRYIAIDTWGGPWKSAGTNSYLVAITKDGGDTWEMLNNSQLATCGYMLDQYHSRVFIKISDLLPDPIDTLDQGSENLGFRVWDADHNFTNNTGSIGIGWYYATNNDIIDEGNYTLVSGWCDGKFSHALQPLSEVPISAKSLSGAYLPDMPITVDVKRYAIETSGAWRQAALGVDRYDIQISDDSGETWYRLDEYPGVQCAQLVAHDDDHVIAYFTPIQGKRYKVRVNDDDNTFSTNPTGNLVVKIYTAVATANAWETCASQYYLKPVAISNPTANLTLLQLALNDLLDWLSNIDDDGGLAAMGIGYPSIAANLPQGIGVNYAFLNGLTYAVGVYAGSYTADSVPGKKTIDISFDNGANWEDLEAAGDSTCAVRIEGGYKRVYFVAPPGANVRLRAQASSYPTATGSLDYIIFASLSNTPSTPYYGTNTPGWAASCTTECIAPMLYTDVDIAGVDLTLPNADVGAWVAYAGCRIEYFLSWCPEHTAALVNLFSYFRGYEPFGTVYDILSTITAGLNEARSYSLVNSCSPDAPIVEGGGDVTDTIYNQITDSSPWKGGPAFDLQSVGGVGSPGENTYSVGGDTIACWSGLDNYLGDSSIGFLYFIDFTKRAFGGIFYYYLNIFFQVVLVGFALGYIQKRWQVIAW